MIIKRVLLLLSVFLISSCKTTNEFDNNQISILESEINKQNDGAILIGFLLKSMSNKEKLTNKVDRVLSISLKNIHSGELYSINLNSKNFGIKKVKAGVYCLNKVVTYINFSISLCDKERITVNPGELKNAGYWLAGINYDVEKVKLRLFKTNTQKLELYEKSSKYYGEFLNEELGSNYIVNSNKSIIGYWYTSTDYLKTYLYDSNGKYFTSDDLSNRGNFKFSGTWSLENGDGVTKLHNGYGSSKIKIYNGKLYSTFENKHGSGTLMVGYRNPIRLWELKDEYTSPVVGYERGLLDNIAQNLNKSIYLKVKYSSKSPRTPKLLGKSVFKRPHDYEVISSNIPVEYEKEIMNKFYKWRFKDEVTEQILTICLINGNPIEQCDEKGKVVIAFELGKAFPL